MAQYSTPQELQKAMMEDLFGVVTNLTEHYLKVLKNNVDEQIYSNPDHPHPSMYQRTGQFLESWIFRFLPQTRPNEFGTEIYSEPDLMVYNPELSQHGSPDGMEDRRAIMPEAILWGAFWDYTRDEEDEWWRYPDTRDFWTPTIDEMDRSFRKKVIEIYHENDRNIIIV